MTYGKLAETQYLLRFEKGEEIGSVLKTFCAEKQIKNASLSGIGSIEQPVLAHYRVDTKKYSEKTFEGIFEVTSLLGTVGLVDGVPQPHMHVNLSDESMSAFGGHLVKGIVSATLEVTLTDYPSEFAKKHSEEIGLNLYELPENLA